MFNAVNTAVFNKLDVSALTTLLGGTAIFYQQAPDHEAVPYVVWSYMAGGDENLTPSRMKNNVLFVRAYTSNQAQAGTIDAAIDALLHNQELTVSGWTNFWMARETDLSLIENPASGEKNYMAGGTYRVRLSQ